MRYEGRNLIQKRALRKSVKKGQESLPLLPRDVPAALGGERHLGRGEASP
jgi:hypothetical protein